MTHPSANAYPSQKANGAYYTPESVVAKLVRWAVRRDSDRLLDPACGDGRFVAAHRNSFGVEQNAEAAATAKARAPWMGLHQGDFFDWAARTRERFDCAAGNPPFIRYQTLDGNVRKRALALCADLGAGFSGLTASWAPFLVATASCLRPGADRNLCLVVGAESRTAGPFMSRSLELAPCASTDATRKQWRVKGGRS